MMISGARAPSASSGYSRHSASSAYSRHPHQASRLNEAERVGSVPFRGRGTDVDRGRDKSHVPAHVSVPHLDSRKHVERGDERRHSSTKVPQQKDSGDVRNPARPAQEKKAPTGDHAREAAASSAATSRDQHPLQPRLPPPAASGRAVMLPDPPKLPPGHPAMPYHSRAPAVNVQPPARSDISRGHGGTSLSAPPRR